MDNYRIRELIEFAEQRSRDYSLPNADIAAYRDTAAALRELMQRSQPQGQAVDREADRARFSDAAFNAWLDTGISDAGHTVWDAVGDTQAAWAGWEARQFAGDAVLISECCGREECGGECGNEWRGRGMYRKPATALSQQPEARGVVEEAMVERITNSVATALYGPPPPPGSNSLTRSMSEPVVRKAVLAALTEARNVR